MSRKLTASYRSRLIRLASTMEKGSESRRAILAGLGSAEIEDRFGSELNTVYARGTDLLPAAIKVDEMYQVVLDGNGLGVGFSWRIDPRAKVKDLLAAIYWLLKNSPVKINSAKDLVDLLSEGMSSSGHGDLLTVEIPTRGFSKEFLAVLPFFA